MQAAEDFDAFVAIVDAGSISEAARALGVPRASLSRQLARLEERLEVRLINRTTRAFVPTPAGQALYPRARALLAGAKAAVESVQRLDDVPRGLLRISSAPLHTPLLGALLSEFIQSYPKVRVELLTSTQHVDLAADQFDLALRGGIVRDPNLIARRLLRTDMLAVASPAYLAERGHPSEVAELSAHSWLGGLDARRRVATDVPLKDGGKIQIDGPLATNDIMALRGAAIGGLGIALLPREFVRSELAAGKLVPVLEESVGIDVSLSLVWLERQFMDPKIEAFVELASRWVKEGRYGFDALRQNSPDRASR